MTHLPFESAYCALAALVAARPELAGFSIFDAAASPAERTQNPIPAVVLVQALDAGYDAEVAALVAAIAAAAPVAHWHQTYTEEEVGRDFLNRYGWFELVGPGGHYWSNATRAYIAYWGEGLYYPWHLHEAEELYFILAGSACFEAEGMEPAVLGPGDVRYHASNQPHAMTTFDSPILCLVLWRGAGIEGAPRMGRE